MKNSEEDIAQVFGKHAKLYARKYFSVERYQEPLLLFLDQISNSASILDVACGPGNLSYYALQKKANLKITGTDIAKEMLTIAKEKIPGGTFKKLACSNLPLLNFKFDGILCGFVLPYLSKSETQKLISDFSLLLKDNGSLLISGNKGDYKNSELKKASTGEGPALSNYLYNIQDIELFLNDNDFEITNTFTYNVDYGGFTAEEFVIVCEK